MLNRIITVEKEYLKPFVSKNRIITWMDESIAIYYCTQTRAAHKFVHTNYSNFFNNEIINKQFIYKSCWLNYLTECKQITF